MHSQIAGRHRVRARPPRGSTAAMTSHGRIAIAVTMLAGMLSTACAATAAEPGPGPPAHAQGGQVAAETNATAEMNVVDRSLRDRICVRLAERAWVGADFEAWAEHGIVTLQAALQVRGVLSVLSEIDLKLASYGSPIYYWWHPYDLTTR